MPFQPSPVTQDLPSSAVRDAEFEWLLCLASALEAYKRTDPAEALTRPRIQTLLRPPLRVGADKSRVA
jgi:hypothetical protein